jgi:hypothetical protein
LIKQIKLLIYLFSYFLFIILYLSFINEIDDSVIRFGIFFILSSLRVLPGINRILIAIQNIQQHSSYLISVKKDLRLARFEPFKLNLNKNKFDRKINFNKKIYFKNVTFSYDDKKKLILKNVNLEINKNDIIGLIGDSGGGKTTLLNILLGFFKPTKGDVIVDKESIFKNINKWHNIIGYVLYNFNSAIVKKDLNNNDYIEVLKKSISEVVDPVILNKIESGSYFQMTGKDYANSVNDILSISLDKLSKISTDSIDDINAKLKEIFTNVKGNIFPADIREISTKPKYAETSHLVDGTLVRNIATGSIGKLLNVDQIGGKAYIEYEQGKGTAGPLDLKGILKIFDLL